MIGGPLKRHFSLIAIPYWSDGPALMPQHGNAAVQHWCIHLGISVRARSHIRWYRPDEIFVPHLNVAAAAKRDVSTAEIASTSVPSIRTNQSPAPGFGAAAASPIGLESTGS